MRCMLSGSKRVRLGVRSLLRLGSATAALRQKGLFSDWTSPGVCGHNTGCAKGVEHRFMAGDRIIDLLRLPQPPCKQPAELQPLHRPDPVWRLFTFNRYHWRDQPAFAGHSRRHGLESARGFVECGRAGGDLFEGGGAGGVSWNTDRVLQTFILLTYSLTVTGISSFT